MQIAYYSEWNIAEGPSQERRQLYVLKRSKCYSAVHLVTTTFVQWLCSGKIGLPNFPKFRQLKNWFYITFGAWSYTRYIYLGWESDKRISNTELINMCLIRYTIYSKYLEIRYLLLGYGKFCMTSKFITQPILNLSTIPLVDFFVSSRQSFSQEG